MDLLVKLMHGSVVEYNHGFDVHEPPKIPIIRSKVIYIFITVNYFEKLLFIIFEFV